MSELLVSSFCLAHSASLSLTGTWAAAPLLTDRHQSARPEAPVVMLRPGRDFAARGARPAGTATTRWVPTREFLEKPTTYGATESTQHQVEEAARLHLPDLLALC